MSWEKVENHLFDKYCVEGEDKELCNLMEEHDRENRNKAIDEFAEKIKGLIAKEVEDAYSSNDLCCEIFQSEIDEIAEQMKGE